MTDAAIVAFAYAAAACLCAAGRRHLERLGFPPARAVRLALAVTGIVCFASAGTLSVARRGWGIGTVEGIGAFNLACIAVALLFPYRPRWTLYLTVPALAGALLAMTVT